MTAGMKRKSYGATPVKVIKTSISLPEVLLKFAEERCALEGFNSFSAYLAHLVRMDKEKKEAGIPVDHGTAPALLNDKTDDASSTSSGENLETQLVDVLEQERQALKKKRGARQKSSPPPAK